MKRFAIDVLIPLVVVGLICMGGAWKASEAVDDFVRPELIKLGLLGGDTGCRR